MEAILAGDRNALAGIDVLRKICNHPDLLQRTTWEGSEEYGAVARSGKLQVVTKVWTRFGALFVTHMPFGSMFGRVSLNPVMYNGATA